jgi:hypothetical protein
MLRGFKDSKKIDGWAFWSLRVVDLGVVLMWNLGLILFCLVERKWAHNNLILFYYYFFIRDPSFSHIISGFKTRLLTTSTVRIMDDWRSIRELGWMEIVLFSKNSWLYIASNTWYQNNKKVTNSNREVANCNLQCPVKLGLSLLVCYLF